MCSTCSTPTRSSPRSPTPSPSRRCAVPCSSATSASATCAPTPCSRDSTSRWHRGSASPSSGASGSGKSTIALLVPRFYDVAAGSVRIDGVDVRDVTFQSLRSQVGVVFEDSFLFSERVRDNIAYGKPDATDAEIEAAARGGGGARLHHGAARRLRHRRRRARAHAVGRAAAAHRAGPRVDHRSRRHDPRRRDLVDRLEDRGRHPRLAAADHGRPHHDPRRASPVDAAARRPHRGARPGPGGRVGHPRGAGGLVRALPRPPHRARGERGRGRAGGAGGRARARPRAASRSTRRPGPTTHPKPRARGSTAAQGSGIAVGRAPGAGLGMGGGGGGAWGAVAAFAPPTPELLAQVDALPPLGDDPEVDLTREVAPDRNFSLRRFIQPFRWALALGFAFVVVDTVTTLVGPSIIEQAINQGIVPGVHRGVAHVLRDLPRGPARELGELVRAAAPDRQDRGAHALRAPRADVRPAPAPVARLLRPRAGRSDHDPHDHRHRRARAAAAAGPAERARQHPEPASASQ